MEKFLGLLVLITLVLLIPKINNNEAQVLGEEKTPQEALSAPEPVKTTSRFETKLEEDTEKIERKGIYKDNPDSEIGDDKVLEEGTDGKKTSIIKITYLKGKEYEREILSIEIINPQEKVVSKGTKIVWRDLDTPDGQIHYWRKMRVWATHYDSHCLGCDEWTAIGMRQGKGIIAVDPKVIKLKSKLYIPGYGIAVAGDTGGAIKGNIIDLGFDDSRTAGWWAHYIDIYLR